MSGQGPYFGQVSWFEKFHPEKIGSARDWYKDQIKRVFQVIDKHLKAAITPYLVGGKWYVAHKSEV
jgi:glutathione S-transferase